MNLSSLIPRNRSQALRVGLFVVVGIFVLRLFYLQVIRHDYYVAQANERQVTQLTINAERGSIYALDGSTPVPLVLNETVYDVTADPSIVKQPEQIVEKLRSVAGGTLVDSPLDLLTNKKSRYAVLAKQLSRTQAELIKKEDFVGVVLQKTSRRVYPETTLGAQMLGYVNADGTGQYGLEGALNSRLKGTNGSLKAVTDVRRIPLTIGNQNVSVPAKDGDNLVLSVDRNIQSKAEQILKAGLDKAKATKGSIVVMDPRNGSIMAMANYPTYNPGDYSKVQDYSVFQNGVVSTPYENGSVIKTFTMATGLDSGAIKYNDTFNNTGVVKVDDSTIRNVEEDPINPQATMTDILRYSLNTGVVHVLQQMGGGQVDQQARQTLYSYFHDRFRFGMKTGIEQAGEAAGTIIGPNEGEGRNIRYANMTFGQGMDLTMIQTTSAFSAMINGGTFYQPQLVKGTLQADGSIKENAPKVIQTNVLSAAGSAQAKEMIYQGRKQGFFGPVDPAGYKVGGKTGTSQIIDPKTGTYSNDNSVGTYIGFGATDIPSYVIMVKVDDSKLRSGYEGTTAAGPIFNDMSNWMISYLQL